MSHFTWKAAFAANCPMCGAHMPANEQHECFPGPLETQKATLGKALDAYLRTCNHERLNEDGICRECGKDCRGIA